MGFRIIMGITNSIVILALYYETTTAINEKANEYFGVSIDISENHKMSVLVQKYKKINKLFLVLFFLLVVISFFYQNFMYILLTHIVIFIGGLGIFKRNVIHYTMNFDELLLDHEPTLNKFFDYKVRKADLYLSKEADNYEYVKGVYNLILPTILCIFMVIKIFRIPKGSIEEGLEPLYIIMLGVNILLMMLSVIIARYIKNKPQIIYSDDVQENVVINFKKKNGAILLVYLLNNINIVANYLFVRLFMQSTILAVSIIMLSSIITTICIIAAYNKIKSPLNPNEENFGNWVYGIFYYNPSDPKLSTNKRFGIGTTLNMAKPLAKLIAVATIVLIIGLYSHMTFLVIGNEIIDPKLLINENEVYISTLDYDYSASHKTIKDIELVESSEIKIIVKTNGVATDKYTRGFYKVKDLGKCFMSTFESSSLVILIKMEEFDVIYSEKTDEQTEELYKKIKNDILKKIGKSSGRDSATN